VAARDEVHQVAFEPHVPGKHWPITKKLPFTRPTLVAVALLSLQPPQLHKKMT